MKCINNYSTITATLLILCGTVKSFTTDSVSSFRRPGFVSKPSLVAPLSPPTYVSSIYSSSSTSLQVVPEPGPCPECSDENGYWDGSVNFVCIACGNEWPVGSAENADEEEDDVIRDSNGNILEGGETVTLTKELGKGLKKGMKITRIRVGDYGDGHDVEATIPGLGTFALKSQFLKKSSK
jgi:protein PhnA